MARLVPCVVMLVSALSASAAGEEGGHTVMAQAPAGDPAQVEPDHFVLEDVPYIGPNWQTRLDGPQDLMFPSAMGALMKYLTHDPALDYRFFLAVSGMAYRQVWHPTKWDCAFDCVWRIAPDPMEPVRRCFEAGGYDCRIVGNRPVCEARWQPLLPFDEYVAPEELQRRVCASLRAGLPVIVFGLGSSAALIAGYEDHGDVLVGWMMLENEGAAERDDLGYVRMRDWLKDAEAALLVGEKREPLPLADAYRKALQWAVEAARGPVVGEYVSGLAAFDAWADALQRDEELQLGDIDVLRSRYMAHFLQGLVIAEGRAFGGEIVERAAGRWLDAAEELQLASGHHQVMHDLMWRLWQTAGGMEPADATLLRFSDPEVRRHLQSIVSSARDQDAAAIAHIERALLTMGVAQEDLPAPSEAEAAAVARVVAREETSGGNPVSLTYRGGDMVVEGVPALRWSDGRDCTFVGALEAALAPTMRPYTYAELMGYSGLAFRTRWFDNPAGAQTRWGNSRWHPVSPHGEGAEEIAAISRATGWQLRAEELPEQDKELVRQRLMTDIVLSIRVGVPVVIGYNTDLATCYGYNIHSMNLLVRDYQRPDQQDVRIPSDDPGLQSPFVFLTALGEPLPPREALLQGIGIAVRNGRREPADGFRFGLDALDAWRQALARYDAYNDGERGLLFLVNWWSLMHLADARHAAVEFLEPSADLLTDESKAALLKALSLYRREAEMLDAFVQERITFIEWWGGGSGVADWSADVRQEQQSLLSNARALEEQALAALDEVLARAGDGPE
jgi:hypothetical protein